MGDSSPGTGGGPDRDFVGPPDPNIPGNPGYKERGAPVNLLDPGEFKRHVDRNLAQYQSEKAAKAAEKARADAKFVGPPEEKGFFGKVGEAVSGFVGDVSEGLGFGEEETDLGAFEQDRPTDERAAQKAVFAEVERNPATFAALQARNTKLGTGYVTAEEAETLGDLSRTAAEARAQGFDVNVDRKSVSAKSKPSFFGLPELQKPVEELLGADFSAPLGTVKGYDRAQRGALYSGLSKGTVKASSTTPSGITTSTFGAISEVAGAAFAGQQFAESLGAFSQAAQLGARAAAVPAAGALFAGYAAYSAFDALAQLSEEQDLLGLSPTKSATTSAAPSASTRSGFGGSGGSGGYEAIIAEQNQTPQTQTPNIPVVAPPRRRPSRGAGLRSTVRTGFFGTELPNVRYAR